MNYTFRLTMFSIPSLFRLDYRISISTMRHMCAGKNPPNNSIKNPLNVPVKNPAIKNYKRKLATDGPDLFQFIAATGR